MRIFTVVLILLLSMLATPILYSFGPRLALPNNHHQHRASDDIYSDPHKHIEDALKEESLAAEAALKLTQTEHGLNNTTSVDYHGDGDGVRFVVNQIVGGNNPAERKTNKDNNSKPEIDQRTIAFFPNGTFEYKSVVYHRTSKQRTPRVVRYRKFQGDFAGNDDGTLTLSNIRKEFGEASSPSSTSSSSLPFVASIARTWKEVVGAPVLDEVVSSGSIRAITTATANEVEEGGGRGGGRGGGSERSIRGVKQQEQSSSSLSSSPSSSAIKLSIIPAVKRPLFNDFLGARDIRLNAVQAGYEWYAMVSKDAERCVLSMPGRPMKAKTITLSRHAAQKKRMGGGSDSSSRDASWLVSLCNLNKNK